MMLTAHVMAGAALATVMPDSNFGRLGAFGVGIASHYALDALPHWERLFGHHYNDQLARDHSSWPKNIFIQGAIDVAISLLVLGWFTHISPNPTCTFIGGIGAILPDIMDSSPWWKHATQRLSLWRVARRLHDGVHMNPKKQRQLPGFTGLVTQLSVIGLSILLMLGLSS